MITSMRLEFVDAGFKALLNSPEVEQLVLSKAQEIADRANAECPESEEGFRAHSLKAGTRYIAFAGTTDDATVRAESENKVLSRAVVPNG